MYGYSQGNGGGSAKADVERLVYERDATAEHDVIATLGLLEQTIQILSGNHDLTRPRIQGDILTFIAFEIGANRLHNHSVAAVTGARAATLSMCADIR